MPQDKAYTNQKRATHPQRVNAALLRKKKAAAIEKLTARRKELTAKKKAAKTHAGKQRVERQLVTLGKKFLKVKQADNLVNFPKV